MIPYFIAAIVFVRLFIGFQTGSLDWILPWYGAQSESKKEKMNGKLILNFASVMMLISLIGVFVALYGDIFQSIFLLSISPYLILAPIICTVIFTYKWSRVK